MKNKRISIKQSGFTMVELLGAVVILGILMMVAIPSVNKYIKNSKERYYETQKKQLIIATKSYLSNSKSVPKRVGETRDISMDELVKNKYITEIKDANKQTCVGTQPDLSGYDVNNLTPEKRKEMNELKNQYTFVRVRRGTDKLHYTAHLWCVNREEDSLESTDVAPINFKVQGNVENGKRIAIISMFINAENLAKEPGLKIVDYTYNIYKGNVNLVEKNGTINSNKYSARHDISRYIQKNGITLTAHLRAVDSKGRVYSGDVNFIPDPVSGSASCPAATRVSHFDDDDEIFTYSFICVSPNGCESDVYTGTYKATSPSPYTLKVQIKDKVDSSMDSTCDFTVPGITTPEPPPPTPGQPVVQAGTGCPSVNPVLKGWTKGSITIKYSLSKGTFGYRVVEKSKKGWKILRRDNKKTIHLKKDTTYASVGWNTTKGHSITKVYKSSGTHFFGVRVKVKSTSKGKVTEKLCDTTYAYGPYYVDATNPKFVSGSVTGSGKKLTVKFTVKDAHSGIGYVYVNQSNKALNAAKVKKKGKAVNKSKYKYKKTATYSTGKHTFYVHVVDRVGNYAKYKIGSKKVVKLKAGCNYRGAKKHSTYSWHCTCGATHSKGYYHLCVSSSGKVYRAKDFNFVCPVRPEKKYKRIPGW